MNTEHSPLTGTRFRWVRVAALLAISAAAFSCGRHKSNVPRATGPTPGVAFSADETTLGVPELYATDFSGGPIVNLSGPLVPGSAGVFPVAWSADRSKIAFVAEKNTLGCRELFIAAASGGAPINVSQGKSVSTFAWAPDGSRLAYTVFPNELFCCDADGGGSVRVSTTDPPDLGSVSFTWAPDSSRLAYLGNTAPADLYTVRPDGTGQSNLTGGWTTGEHRWSPDSSRIAYRGVSAPYQLVVSQADGSGSVAFPGVLNTGDETMVPQFQWAPDGSRLAYLARQISSTVELFTSLADGTGNVRVSDPSPGLIWVDQFSWAPDGSRLAFRGSTIFPPTTVELYTVLPDGSGRINLTQSGVAYLGDHLWAPDSSRLAYQLAGLHTVLSGGGGIADIAPGKIIGEYKWAPDSSRLAYHVATITYDLFSCLPDGSGTAQVSGPLVAGGGHQMMFYWSSDSSRIVYSTDEITLGVHELFAAPPSGGRVKLFSPTLLGGQVWGIYPK